MGSRTCRPKKKRKKMGRVYLEHFGGSKPFSCAQCDTFLTNRAELISTRFTGATGRAFLFNRVVNLNYSETQDRIMLTGRHIVQTLLAKNAIQNRDGFMNLQLKKIKGTKKDGL